MALLDIHTIKNIPIHVYTTISDIDYNAIDETIVIALNHNHNFYCKGIFCNSSCPFWDSSENTCIDIAIKFLREHYSSQYLEYFI